MTDRTGWEGILDKDEMILWQGRPRPGLTFQGFQPMEAAMGVFFMVFSVGWMNMAMSMGNGFRNGPGFVKIFPLFGLIFFFIGLWNAFGKHLWQSILLSRTHYTLTDRRAFIAVDHPFAGRSLEDHPIGKDSVLRLYDGSPGSVQFGTRRVSRTSYRHSGSGPGRSRSSTFTRPLVFHRIDDPRAVYGHLRGITNAQTNAPVD